MKITFIKTGKRVKTKESKEQKDNVKESTTTNRINKHTKSNKKFYDSEMFKTVFRKNQIVLLTLALMLVTAGYMNYNNSNNEVNIQLAELGDAKLVSTNAVENETQGNEVETNGNVVENIVDTNGNAENTVNENNNEKENEETSNDAQTNTTQVNSKEVENSSDNKVIETNNENSSQDYYTQTRLERQTMYSQMLEAYQKILENEKIPNDQKSIASNEIKNINDRINAISIVENLIKTKGFEDVVLLINDNNINVVVKQASNLSDEQVAQIANIVSRELKAEIEDIHITMHK